ncbi:MAG: glycosyltransferase, partial [Ruminococcaceae bacterium]|nr:glycosyltransferase [Oscillospiraceae bacterium]
ANYLREAIDSALNQTYDNIEIIVVNDGSCDEGKTEEIALSYEDKIRYFSKENGGVATAVNFGIKNMKGEYFSWLSHDDMYAPKKVEHEISALSQVEDKRSIVSGGHKVINSKGRYLWRINARKIYSSKELSYPLFILFRSGLHGSALLIHKSHFERVGVFNTSLPTTQDHDMWFRIFRGQNVIHTPYYDVISRSHSEQDSKKSRNEHNRECDSLWTNMGEALTDEERTAIGGSPYLFYSKTAEFLRNNSAYFGAIEYYEKKATEELSKSYYKNNSIEEVLTESEVLFACSSKVAKSFINDLTKKQTEKRRIAISLKASEDDYWLKNSAFLLAETLSDIYDVLLIYIGKSENRHKSDEKSYTEIHFPVDSFSAKGFAHLLIFAKTEAYISVYNNDLLHLETLKILGRLGVKTFALNFDTYFDAYSSTKLFSQITAKKDCLREATVAVWNDKISASQYSLTNNNSAYIECPIKTKPAEKTNRKKSLISACDFLENGDALESVLRLFSKLLCDNPGLILSICGPHNLSEPIPSDPRKSFDALIKLLHIPSESLRLSESFNEFEQLFSEADINIIIAPDKDLRSIVINAQSAAVPTVAVNDLAVGEFITNDYNGILVPQNSLEQFYDAISDLLNDSEKLLKMKENAIKSAACYAPSIVENKWQKLIEESFNADENSVNEFLRNNYIPVLEESDELIKYRTQMYERFADLASAILLE